MKVVINACFGGFSLSEVAIDRYAAIKGLALHSKQERSFVHRYTDRAMTDDHYWSDRDIPRDDPALVQAVEELGAEADGQCAALRVVEIPDGVDWEISEYDGSEHIAEKHRTWA